MMLLLKASLLLSATLAGAWLLRRASAAARHQLWSVAFAALLVLPLLAAALPAVDVPVPARWRGAVSPPDAAAPSRAGAAAIAATAAPGAIAGVTRRGPESTPPAPSAATSPSAIAARVPSAAAVLWTIWIGGALAGIGALLISLLRAQRLSRSAHPIDDEAWLGAAGALSARLGLKRRPRLAISDAVRTPMAGGAWRPVVFLPADATGWTAERRDIVLAHEIAHLASRDPIRHIAARLAVAAYWFHPLAWLAARQAAVAREQACDEAVLALGVRPSVYAQTLLDLADTFSAESRAAAALPMIEHSLLEQRLMAILKDDVRPVARRPIALAACASLIVIGVAAARPSARAVTVDTPAAVTPAATAAGAGRPRAAAMPAENLAPPSMPAERLAPAPQPARSDTACWSDGLTRADFTGYTNTDRRGVIQERVGSGGGSRIIQRYFDDLLVCMLSDEVAGANRPSDWPGKAGRVVIETRRPGTSQRLEVRRQGNGVQETWRVNDAERPLDAAAQAWRTAVLAVLDSTWEISTLRGQESTLRGDISILRGEESTLRGDISTLRGDVSTMRGRQSTIRGEESTLRGQISEIQGHVSTLRGRISTEQGEISRLVSNRYGAGDAERERIAARIRDHEAAIDRIERELRDYNAPAKIGAVEKQIDALDADGKVAAIEAEVRAFDERSKTAAIEHQIAALEVDRKVEDIERRSRALDADGRTRRLENQLDEALRRLQRAIAAVK